MSSNEAITARVGRRESTEDIAADGQLFSPSVSSMTMMERKVPRSHKLTASLVDIRLVRWALRIYLFPNLINHYIWSTLGGPSEVRPGLNADARPARCVWSHRPRKLELGPEYLRTMRITTTSMKRKNGTRNCRAGWENLRTVLGWGKHDRQLPKLLVGDQSWWALLTPSTCAQR